MALAKRRFFQHPYAFPLTLLGVYAVWWTWMAIAPSYRDDWLLENVLVFLAIPALIIMWRWLRLSNFAYGALFIFFSLHTIGSHYTYAEVPYDQWWTSLTGHSLDAALGFERNHFDRLVHFCYGLLLMPAIDELFAQQARPRLRIWRLILPVFFIMGHAVLYEAIEWFAAEVFGGELGQAYLGTQGDVWDAQKDSMLAALGALISQSFIVWLRLMPPLEKSR
jgi:putative membrane protein